MGNPKLATGLGNFDLMGHPKPGSVRRYLIGQASKTWLVSGNII